jgi:SAM-dependent methyltransferase
LDEGIDWGDRAQRGFLAAGIDPADRLGYKNDYIDLLQKVALEQVLDLKGGETVLDFGCGSGRFSYWIAPRVKRVVGLEVTPEMIALAEKHRSAENVEFVVYDGVHFPTFPCLFDLILSVGVLQVSRGEGLKETVLRLARCLKEGGRFYLIEQASDDPRVNRPSVGEYLNAIQKSDLECLQHYPIRNGRWWMLYLIRYGLIPRKYFPRVALRELSRREAGEKIPSSYKDCLFVAEKT